MVVKFGGTSVASAERWAAIEVIVRRHRGAGRRVLVVCSAVAGITNRLESLLAEIDRGRSPDRALAALIDVHTCLAGALGLALDPVLGDDLTALAALTRQVAAGPRPVPARSRAAIMAWGELLSSRLGAGFLGAHGAAAWLDAREVLRGLDGSERAERYLSARCDASFDPGARRHLDALAAPVVVTQGFIARDVAGETVLLGRGGSDASAAYLAVAIGANAIELWSDVPGMFTADPRTIGAARLLRRLSYDEAETLGALGAKVLHPRTIEPARAAGIPIRLGWTAHPELAGTRILGARLPRGAKAVVSRERLVLLSMRRRSSWQPVGFMAEVSARFRARGLSMDLIASSPSEIRATLDLAAFPSAAADLDDLLADLAEVCHPRAMHGVACVSVAGAGVVQDLACSARGVEPFAETPLHLVSHSASGGHVSVIVDERAASELVSTLHERLIAPRDDDATFGPSWSSLGIAAAPRKAVVASCHVGSEAP